MSEAGKNFYNEIFSVNSDSFSRVAIELCKFQYEHNSVYKSYCDLIKCNVQEISELMQIPFLPISFFKTHSVVATSFEPQVVFESSGTTGSVNSKHFVRDAAIYERSFSLSFRRFHGEPSEYCILGLLPSYLERSGSSLVYMVKQFIQESGNAESGFYLHNYEQLFQTLNKNETNSVPSLLIGVTYALLDFAESFPMTLQHTIVMETGGMKGRKKEITRKEVHDILQQQLGVTSIHSEYGMTELLSQAYANESGIFHCPDWMKIFVRDEDDPFSVCNAQKKAATGAANIIDLANIYSCSFIATDDLCRLHPDGSFEILGRLDNSDIRGCSLLTL